MRCSCPVVGAFDCSPRPFFATAKLAIFFEIRKHFFLCKRLLLPYSELFRIIPNYLLFLLAYIAGFLYLCTNKQLLVNKIILIIHIYFLNKTIMQQNQCLTMGRTQLAQMYFPFIQPKSAWEKLRALLLEDPALEHLTKLKRRTFLPAEVNIIYQHLGQP